MKIANRKTVKSSGRKEKSMGPGKSEGEELPTAALEVSAAEEWSEVVDTTVNDSIPVVLCGSMRDVYRCGKSEVFHVELRCKALLKCTSKISQMSFPQAAAMKLRPCRWCKH